MTKWPGMGDDVKGTPSYMISGMVVYDASAMYDFGTVDSFVREVGR